MVILLMQITLHDKAKMDFDFYKDSFRKDTTIDINQVYDVITRAL